ncbi:MAG: uroporphyrinogen decarboxylase family protein [Anaerolineales bacterium]|jgi:uroporphyrinogen decarboxylase
MDAYERIESAIKLKALPAGEVPVAPLIITYTARLAKMTQAQIFSNVGSWQQAVRLSVDRIGAPDMGFALWPRDVPFSEAMRFKLPGRELGEDDLFQINEQEVMQPADYERILRQGYNRWFLDYNLRLQPDLPTGWRGRAIITYQLIRMGLRIRGNAALLDRLGIPPAFYGGGYPPFDFFSLARSVTKFILDLHDCPELVQKACEASLDPIVNTMMQPLQLTNGKRVCIYPMRSSASFISPKMFEKLALPQLKRIVEFFVRKGITPILHCDANWNPMLPYFREFPRASCILELDGDTDIFKAKQILGDWMCLKGNVPAPLLAFGETGEVEVYCEKLIREIGHGGGFILSSGCEVPLNAKVENVQAMLRVARGWGAAKAQ